MADPAFSETAAVAATRLWKGFGHRDIFNKYASEAVAFVKFGYSIRDPSETALPLAPNPKNIGADKPFPWRWTGLRDDF
jgi:hypothetical protein